MELSKLIEAVSEFASRTAEKLRGQNSMAAQLLVFAHTSPFRAGPAGPKFSESTVIGLRRPTADTRLLIQAAVLGVTHIYRPGFQLAKAGVMLLDLMPATAYQGELDFDSREPNDQSGLMSVLDAINDRFGRGTLHVGSTGTSDTPRGWAMRQERLSPQYTTKWSDLPVVSA